jgi:hypothetical protein
MKFVKVNLSMNVATTRGGKLNPGGPVECSCSDGGSCNDGGSYICTAGTDGCEAGLSCVGTSYSHQNCGGGSNVEFPGFDINMSVKESEIAVLRVELQKLVATVAARQ